MATAHRWDALVEGRRRCRDASQANGVTGGLQASGNSTQGECADANDMRDGRAETCDADNHGMESLLAGVAIRNAMAGVDDATLADRNRQTARAFALDRCDASPICTTFLGDAEGGKGGDETSLTTDEGAAGAASREREKRKSLPVARSSRGRIAHPWPWSSIVAIGGRRMGKYQPCLIYRLWGWEQGDRSR